MKICYNILQASPVKILRVYFFNYIGDNQKRIFRNSTWEMGGGLGLQF